MESFEISPIGIIKTPFEQKLGVPRQPNLCPSVVAEIHLDPQFKREDTLREIETFTHLWLIYRFHKSDSWRETIKPPRLGGKEKVGVFASRAPHRPNQIGFSVVKLLKVDENNILHVSGVDILDGTPLLDIKPYLPMWDSIPEATNGWVDSTPELKPLKVDFSMLEQSVLGTLSGKQKQILEETLCWDPRPAYTKDESRTFIHNVGNLEVTWKKTADKIVVLELKQL